MPSLHDTFKRCNKLEKEILQSFQTSCTSPPQLLPLNLIHKVKVRLIEMVNTNVTVLTTRSIGRAGGVDVDGVERTEVTLDTANLVLEDLVVETGLEFTLAGGGCSDIHSGLATSQNNVVLLSCDGGAVQWGIGDVGFHDSEVTGRHKLDWISYIFSTQVQAAYLGGLVFRGGKEVAAVGRELNVVDLLVELVCLDAFQLFTGL